MPIGCLLSQRFLLHALTKVTYTYADAYLVEFLFVILTSRVFDSLFLTWTKDFSFVLKLLLFNHQSKNITMSLSSPHFPCINCSLSTMFIIILSLTIFPCSAKSNNASAVTHRNAHRQMSSNYYSKSCPQVEQLVASVTGQQFRNSPVSGPATIRLFFHDCFVEVNYSCLWM